MNDRGKNASTSAARAMLFHGAGRPLQAVDFPLPEPHDGELLVEILCCTLCGSDLHTYSGQRQEAVPSILGHEILGRVARMSGDSAYHDALGRPLNIGDRVTWSVVVACGECFYCRHDLPQKCEQLFKYGHAPVRDEHQLAGGLAEYCLLKAGSTVLRVPDSIPDLVAAPTNCATATIAAALRAAGNVEDAVVLVQGAGMLGLTACAMAREAGAREVIACDVQPGRLAMAERFGAGGTVHLDDSQRAVDALRAGIDDATGGRGADIVLELSGSSKAAELSCQLARIGGACIWVGSVSPGPSVSLAAETIVRRMLTIRGVHNYGPRDLAAAVEFLEANHTKYPFEELVERTFPLSEAQLAFDHAIKGGALRVAVVPDRSHMK